MTIEAEFISTLGKDEFLFRHLDAREELGRLPEFRLELLRRRSKPRVDAKSLLGTNAGLRITLQQQEDRYLQGLVTRFERGGALGDFFVYRLELRPWLWHLTLGSDCRIFQNKTAVEIIDAVFDEYRTTGRVTKKLNGSFATRPYTVQYRESDYEFVARLMEEEGIYYYFTYARNNQTLVLCDHPGAHQPMSGGGKLRWLHEGDRRDENAINQWVRSHALRPLKFTHTDFAPDEPTASLMSSHEWSATYTTPARGYEVYEYPGKHENLAMDGTTADKKTQGSRMAEMRVDTFESGHVIAAGITRERRLTVGSTFDLENHPDEGGYLVTAAVYTMEFEGYDTSDERLEQAYVCQFEAVPKSVTFRPQRVMSKAVVNGPQTAIVVGPSGGEIETDKYGRVKVQFHWDRQGQKNEQSSCWLRVSQPWASKGFGFMALPRIGDEVVVEFLEGDPDRPLITGRVYNGDNMPPWELPDQATVSGVRTRSTKGGSATTFNELRFDDKKGSEYVWFQAEKDYHHWVKNDTKVTIEGMRKQLVKKDDQLKIDGKLDGEIAKTVSFKIGDDTHGSIAGDLLLKIGGATGLKIGGATQLDTGGAMKLSTGAALDVAAASGIKLGTDTAVHIKANTGVMIDGGMSLTIKAGSGFIVLDASGVSIVGPMVKINSGGSATPAQKAQKPQVPAPKDPPALPEHKDPLSK
jgi:type VI secretion system secreted protein VgrG